MGSLGYGWRSSLHQLIRRNACGDFIVTSGNQAMWFRENAAGELVPTRGFHGTLRRKGEGWLVFYGKNGTRWAFEQLSPAREIWWLVEVASPGQEITRWVYRRASGEPLLPRMELPDGSALEVHHRRLEARGRLGTVIGEWRWRDSRVVYSYDDDGLLSTATESSGAGTTTWEYAYARIGDVPVLAREESRNEAGDLLYSRDFRYVSSTLLVGRPGGGDYASSTPRVTRIVDSAGGDTRFAYSGPANSRRWQNAATTVDDGGRTVYRFDADGAPVATETAKGTVERVWDRSDLLLTSVVTEDGARSEYQYDPYGNVIRATEGEEVTTYRYWSPDRFEPPYIKDRVSEVEDRSGRRYYYCYDRHGRQVGCPNA